MERSAAREASLAYGALIVWGMLWPQVDVAETLLALHGGGLIEGNPLFSAVFHAGLGLFAGLLLHAGLSLAVLAFSMATRQAHDSRIRHIAQVFLVCWAVLGIVIVGHNGVVLLLHWLNSWLN